MIEIKCLRLTLAKPASPNLVVRHMVQRGLVPLACDPRVTCWGLWG